MKLLPGLGRMMMMMGGLHALSPKKPREPGRGPASHAGFGLFYVEIKGWALKDVLATLSLLDVLRG